MKTTSLWRCVARSVTIASVLVLALVGRAEPRNYKLYPLDTGPAWNLFAAPVINNAGVVAFLSEEVIPASDLLVIKNAGAGNTIFSHVYDLGLGVPLGPIDLNDSGAVAILAPSQTDGTRVLGRIAPDGSFTPLAEAYPDGSKPFWEFHPDGFGGYRVAMNNSGQIAMGVTNTDLTSSILRFDGGGITEIARTTSTFFAFGQPTLNDAGVVAFHALNLEDLSQISSYTGSGGPLTNESPGHPGRYPVVNNEGVLLISGESAGERLFTAQGGVVTPVVHGDEDPLFQLITGYDAFSMNNFGDIVFQSHEPPVGTTDGLFTGNDPVADLVKTREGDVVKIGETVFGKEVIGIQLSRHAINDRGQITFLLTLRESVFSAPSYIIRADPLPDHDLAVTDVKPPSSVTLSASKPQALKKVTVRIQNQSLHNETIPDLSTLQKVVTLTGNSLGACPDLATTLTPPKSFPVVLKPKQKLSLKYEALYTKTCVHDGMAGVGHEDYRYVATVDHGQLAAHARLDEDPSDDVCPRTVAPPFRLDPSQAGTIKDKGCGEKKADRTFGAEILTDVVVQ